MKDFHKGFTLIEVLIAMTLIGVCTLMLPRTYIGAARVFQKMQKINSESRESYRLWRYLESDLRNAVTMKAYPFETGPNTFSLVTLKKIQNEGQAKGFRQPFKVTYKVEKDTLIREAYLLNADLKKIVNETVLIRNMKSLELYYPFRDIDGLESYKNEWPNETKSKLRRVLKILITLRGQAKNDDLIREKWISLPQGTWAPLAG